MHPFEKAGLGVAPFRFVGVEYRVGPIKFFDPRYPGVTCECGSPGQPMGTCDFCGMGIAECCIIKDVNGKQFIVGNVCVEKTAKDYDPKLVSDTKKAVTEARRIKKLEKDNERIGKLKALLDTPEGISLLTAQNHPFISGKSMYDYATWMLQFAGVAGKIKVCKMVEALQKTGE